VFLSKCTQAGDGHGHYDHDLFCFHISRLTG
jgi:hypothetical protein